MKIFNTLNGKKETFEPIDSNHIKIYACGPTVYNYAHIGNARMAVVFDAFVRTLKAIYPNVLLCLKKPWDCHLIFMEEVGI